MRPPDTPKRLICSVLASTINRELNTSTDYLPSHVKMKLFRFGYLHTIRNTMNLAIHQIIKHAGIHACCISHVKHSKAIQNGTLLDQTYDQLDREDVNTNCAVCPPDHKTVLYYCNSKT